MDARNDGGPAFPYLTASERDREITTHEGEHGMSLRDYFAAKAPISLHDAMVAWGMGDDLTYCLQCNGVPLLSAHAKLCLQWADAMLKARAA